MKVSVPLRMYLLINGQSVTLAFGDLLQAALEKFFNNKHVQCLWKYSISEAQAIVPALKTY